MEKYVSLPDLFQIKSKLLTLVLIVILGVAGAFIFSTVFSDPTLAATVTKPTIGPPFYGRSQLGHTYRSKSLSPNSHSYEDVMSYYGDALYHPYPAIDFKLPIGRPILAVAKGVIAISSEDTENPDTWPRRPGKFIVLNPDDPALPNFAYKHLSVSNVMAGQRVNRGQVIGQSGNTSSPDAHLHFDAHTTIEGFNTYPNQADYGRIKFWQCGREIILNKYSATMARVINPQPTRAASIQYCNL